MINFLSGLFASFAAFICVHVNAATDPNITTVVVKAATLTEVSQTLSYPAIVQAKTQATILAEADGVVRKIHSQLGQSVKAGSRLITIQQTDPIFKYAPVSSISPVLGIVSELHITEGALVTKGQKLASVMDPKNLKIIVEVPARDLRLLKMGLQGTLESPSLASSVPLVLQGLSPSVDPSTGTASAELAPTQGTQTLHPGLIGKVTFKANLHQGFLIPEDAIVENQKATFLRVVVDGKAKKIPVVVGARMRGFAEITSGLTEGAQVVERASGFLADGDAVKVQQ